MPRPSKPFAVLVNEKKSHRTKAELKQRKQGEESLSSGVALKARTEVKTDPIAYKEFKRVNALLKNIQKNDAIYEPIINRYCLIQSECIELEHRREYFFNLIQELKISFDELEPSEKSDQLIDFTKEIARITNSMMSIDKMLQTKRRMLLDIEKENVMTIAAALRSIPKQEEKSSNKLLEALNGD